MLNSNLKSKIAKARIVSFDVFDTLVIRNVKEPHIVFDVMSVQLINQSIVRDGLQFKKDRIVAEKEAYRNAKKEEITLDDIYKYLNKYENVERIKEIELDTEKRLIEKRMDIYNIYEYCLSLGKKIVFTSDMYLERENIEEILFNCGYKVYQKLYLSSEIGMRKSTGNLFRYLIKEEKILSKDILHIGDNYKSDYFIPKMLGINAVHINRIGEKRNSIFTEKIIENISRTQSDLYLFGVEYLGPLMTEYCMWLHKRIVKDCKSSVYFLSREGKFIKECYEKIYGSNPRFKYLYVSRHSLRVPLIREEKNFKNICSRIDFRTNPTFNDFCEKCGVSQKIKKRISEEYDIKLNEEIRFNKEKIEKAINSNLVDILENSQKQYELLKKYLEKEEFFNDGSKLLIDIGWKGTMQSMLCELFEEEAQNIYGLYLGGMNSSNLVNKSNFIENYRKEIEGGMTLIETFFMADHGSIKGYGLENGIVVPQLDVFEFSKEDRKKIEEIQKGAFKYIEMISGNILHELEISDKNYVIKKIMRVLVKPTSSEIKMFSELPFFDSFKSKMICRRETNTVDDLIQSFKLSGWKIGYLKNMFKIKFPYLELYLFLKKILNT